MENVKVTIRTIRDAELFRTIYIVDTDEEVSGVTNTVSEGALMTSLVLGKSELEKYFFTDTQTEILQALTESHVTELAKEETLNNYFKYFKNNKIGKHLGDSCHICGEGTYFGGSTYYIQCDNCLSTVEEIHDGVYYPELRRLSICKNYISVPNLSEMVTQGIVGIDKAYPVITNLFSEDFRISAMLVSGLAVIDNTTVCQIQIFDKENHTDVREVYLIEDTVWDDMYSSLAESNQKLVDKSVELRIIPNKSPQEAFEYADKNKDYLKDIENDVTKGGNTKLNTGN